MFEGQVITIGEVPGTQEMREIGAGWTRSRAQSRAGDRLARAGRSRVLRGIIGRERDRGAPISSNPANI